jgi:hypothetical protein
MHLVTDGNSFFSGYIGKYGLHSPFNRSGLREVCGTREAAEWGVSTRVIGKSEGVVISGAVALAVEIAEKSGLLCIRRSRPSTLVCPLAFFLPVLVLHCCNLIRACVLSGA